VYLESRECVYPLGKLSAPPNSLARFEGRDHFEAKKKREKGKKGGERKGMNRRDGGNIPSPEINFW